MSDTRRRELERATCSDVASRAALVAERLRAGLITVDQVRVAAYLDEPAARECLGAAAPAPVRDLGAWWAGLLQLDANVAARAAGVVLSRVLRAWPTPNAAVKLERLVDVLACPCWWCEEASYRASFLPVPELVQGPSLNHLLSWAERRVLSALRPGRAAGESDTHQLLTELRRAGVGRGELRTLLRDALGPWLLGDADPLIPAERGQALRRPRAVAYIASPGASYSAWFLELNGPSVGLELQPLEAIWATRAPGPVRQDRWTVRGPFPSTAGTSGPAGLGLTFKPRLWRIDAFVGWVEFCGDPRPRAALRRAVAALAQVTRTSSVVWTSSANEAASGAFEAEAPLDELRRVLDGALGPPVDLDEPPANATWCVEAVGASGAPRGSCDA